MPDRCEKMSKKIIKNFELLLSKDQDDLKKYRAGLISGRELKKANRQRVNILKDWIDKHGFPTKTVLSRNAYKTAVTTVLHSENISFLNKFIVFLELASPDEVDKSDIAFLIDKKLVLQKQPQFYGTQFKKMKNGSIKFLKIKDPKSLNQRRKSLGMPSFQSYKRLVAKYNEH